MKRGSLGFEVCKECEAERIAKEKKESDAKIAEEKAECLGIIMSGLYGEIPKRFASATITDFTEPYKYSFGDSLLITGPCGTGKTHLAVALCKLALADKLKKMSDDDIWVNAHEKMVFGRKFYNFQELSIKIKSSFRSESESMADLLSDVLEGFKIVDDIGTSKPTETAIEALYTITNSRYEDMLPTIYTTNLTLTELSGLYGDRIASRLSSCRHIKLTGKDRRLEMR